MDAWLDALATPRHPGTMTQGEPELDCLACGACCRQASDGRILVPAEDLVRWKRQGRADLLATLVPGHFGELAFESTADGACVHLGTTENANACRIYEDRGTTCHEFERGSWQCREFRRDMGIEPARVRA
jgi:Fe-S-cluster containining protein